MIYYRVRKEFDQHPHNPRVRDGNILIANELYTERERNSLLPLVSAGAFERVEIPKNRTYWCFGARFELKNDLYTDLRMEQQEQM